MMIPLAAYESPDRTNAAQAKIIYGTVEWADGLFERLEATTLKDCLRWPKRIARIVVAELCGEFADGPSVLRLDLAVSQESSPDEAPFEVGFWAQGMEEMKMIPDLVTMPDVNVSMA